ncbi:hypothetical protein V3C99_015683 [Haemonchus contortus]
MTEFSTADQRADFWKVRLVPQNTGEEKVYFFPSLLERLKERPQFILNSALAAREAELSILLPDKLTAAAQKECANQNVKGDPLIAYIGGYVDSRPSAQDIVKHLQRSYLEFYERNEHCRSRELVSLIDTSLMLNVTTFAQKLCEDNNYEHDLLQLRCSKGGPEVWDDYKMSVMLRLSRGGSPSPEMLEAATITVLICDFMAGPSARRKSAIAEMAAHGLKLDAMVLAKLYFPNSELLEQLSSQCSNFFEESVNSEAREISEIISSTSEPFFQRNLLHILDQLSCYRILRIDFALNEKAPLQKKLVGRLEIAKSVRYLIAYALAYRNYEAVTLVVEDAIDHLDKYSYFSELEQIVYPMAIGMLSEAVRMIFHAKPATVGWKKQKDEGDKLGCALQQHPNGYIGGLVEMWIKRDPLLEISRTSDIYRQHSLHTTVEGIASVLRDDDLLNPICRGMLLFACDLVCTLLDAIFGGSCLQISEIVKANSCLEHHTGIMLVRRLTKGVLSPSTNDRLRTLLEQLCDFSTTETLASKDAALDTRTDLIGTSLGNKKATYSSGFPDSIEEHQKTDENSLLVDRCGGAKSVKRRAEEAFDDSCRQVLRSRFTQEKLVSPAPAPEEAATTGVSEQNSDMNDGSSVAPSRSVCEQVATMMEGVKFSRERAKGKDKSPNHSHTLAVKAKSESDRPVKVERISPRSGIPSSVARSSPDGFHDVGIARKKNGDVDHVGSADQEDSLEVRETRCDTGKNSVQHDPSLKTKWLPDDAATTCGAADGEPLDSTTKAVGQKSVLGPDAAPQIVGGNINPAKGISGLRNSSTSPGKIISPAPEGEHGTLIVSPTNDGVMDENDAEMTKNEEKEGSRLQSPLSPGLSQGGRKSPHHKLIEDKGKAMIHKLIIENNNVNSRSRLVSERQNDNDFPTNSMDTLEKTRSFGDFTGEKVKQADLFRATREDVFCESSLESIAAGRTPSFDDDIAGAFSNPSDTAPKYRKMEVYDKTTKEHMSSEVEVNAIVTNVPSLPVPDEPTKRRVSSSDDVGIQNALGELDSNEEDKSSSKEVEFEAVRRTTPSNDDHDANVVDQDVFLPEPPKRVPTGNIGEDFMDRPPESDDEVGSDEILISDKKLNKERKEETAFVRSSPEQITQKIEYSTNKTTEEFGRAREPSPQKRFMSGGFGSSRSSGFGSFGSSHTEKENVPAFNCAEFYSADRGGGFDGERSGGGSGRGDQRGGRGRGFDREARFRDNYRDRDARDGNGDGYRPRGGYGGGGGRDSQGRSGFRGGRN